jgi:hypothetical protein
MSGLHILVYRLNYGFEYLRLGHRKVIWYQQNVSTGTQIARVPCTYVVLG